MAKHFKNDTRFPDERKLQVKIFLYLWFPDHFNLVQVNRKFQSVVSDDAFKEIILRDLFTRLQRPLGHARLQSNSSANDIIKRLSAWPSTIDISAVFEVRRSRNSRICLTHTHFRCPCFMYHGHTHKNVVLVADNHLPCFPTMADQPAKGTIGGKGMISLGALKRFHTCNSIAPFTTVMYKEQGHLSLSFSCLAYFEVQFYHVEGKTVEDEDVNHIAIGLAASKFPLKKIRLGLDIASIGYHKDGKTYHDSKEIGRPAKLGAAFEHGDCVGCGIIYPPLGHPNGKIVFTKNGGVVDIIDFCMANMLAVQWFPAVVSCT